MSGLDLEAVRYLLVSTKKYHIRHIARLHDDGQWLPICNAHYSASHDGHVKREVRPPKPHEVDYPICKRCLAWWKPQMVV